VLTPDELRAALRDYDYVLPTLGDRFDASVFADVPSPRCRMLGNFGVGYNHIDVAAAKAAGVIVTNTPGAVTNATADIALLLILATARRAGEGERLLRAGRWQGWGPTQMLGYPVSGRSVGIIGLGRIGEAGAVRAKAFGLNIIYNKRHRLPASVEDELGITFEPEIDRLVARSDIISLHCPLTPETDKIINADRIAQMKGDAYIINSSRGELIDEDALIDALETGRIAGAGLDVYTHEPAVDSRLFDIPNVVLLPHLGSATFEGREASGERVITNIRVWADGHRPPDQVLEGWQ
jgi:glyoxylate reductase